MQKAESQHGKVQRQPSVRQGGGVALESSQGERIAQLEAMVEASPQSGKLAQLSAMANNSPGMAVQRKAISAIHNSPNVTAQRQQLDKLAGEAAQREEAEEPLQPKVAQREAAPAKPDNTGLPDNLKNGIETLSGMSMDNVKVHYNSSQSAQLNALAYAQGTDIHVAPGQEQHLPHEAWHVVQQAQGRVKPTMQMKDGVPVNDDQGLEHEADVMGGRAAQLLKNRRGNAPHLATAAILSDSAVSGSRGAIIQRMPSGAYAGSVPGANGMQWDTKNTVSHNNATVPARSIAVMKEPPNGGTPSVNPSGWSWLQGKLGKLKGQWVRFHIINAKLGGPGNDTENLVPTTVASNLNAGWRSVEDEAKESASVTKTWTYLDVSLTYDNAFPAGIPKTISGDWGSWDGSKWVSKKASGTITQADPSGIANGGYLPGSQIPKGHLKNYGAPDQLKNEIAVLIGASYTDQDAFESAWETQFEMTDEKHGQALFSFQGRCYVDEDDNLPGPYIVLVKTT
ncbi:MAG: DUF4157 domain-containing protein [Gallionella sp.]